MIDETSVGLPRVCGLTTAKALPPSTTVEDVVAAHHGITAEESHPKC